MLSINSDNMFHFEHTRNKSGVTAADSTEAEKTEESKPQSEKKIVDYNEHGHAI